MPRAESSNRPPDDRSTSQGRVTALIGLLVAMSIGIFTWFALTRAADSGVARLARIDEVRIVCDSAWRQAASHDDTVRVDFVSLRDTIDPGSSAELSRCGHLRPAGMPAASSNPRELTGRRDPRGPH